MTGSNSFLRFCIYYPVANGLTCAQVRRFVTGVVLAAPQRRRLTQAVLFGWPDDFGGCSRAYKEKYPPAGKRTADLVQNLQKCQLARHPSRPIPTGNPQPDKRYRSQQIVTTVRAQGRLELESWTFDGFLGRQLVGLAWFCTQRGLGTVP